MQIFVRGLSDRTLTLEVRSTDTVRELKALIEEKEGIPPEDQRVATFAGRQLQDEHTIADYNIQRESTLDLSVRLCGGHCQVPCGIFDDPRLVVELKEACATIRKAVAQITELSQTLTALSVNQLTRWANTKEEHASKIVELVTEYCLAQRVKPPSDPKSPFKSESDYIDALKAHHAVMLAAVKCKQTVDSGLVDTLEAAVADMGKIYTASSASTAAHGGASETRIVGGSGSEPATPAAARTTTSCGDGCSVS